MMTTTTEKSSRDNKLVMFCECCEKKYDRWVIEMVEPEDVVFEVNALLKDHTGEGPTFNFACPHCVTELALIPLQTDRAKKFRRINEKLRKVYSPTTIH